MDRESLYMMDYFIGKYLKDMDSGTVLDIGSKKIDEPSQPTQTYRDSFGKRFDYTGMDLEAGDNVDIVGYESIEGEYDIVVSGQVMEHVNRPWEWLKNLTRYSRKHICIIAPWSFQEHRFPIDTYRYLPDGMRDLFDYAEIKEVEILKGERSTIGIGTTQDDGA